MKLNCPVCRYPFNSDIEPYSCVLCGAGFEYSLFYDGSDRMIFRDYGYDDKTIVENFPLKNKNKLNFSKLKI